MVSNARALPDIDSPILDLDTTLFLLTYLRSGNVPMTKLNFAAKHDYEYINNFKVLQEVFKRNKIDKVIMIVCLFLDKPNVTDLPV